MNIRALTEADAAAYRQIRLRGLREDPSAFGSSYEEEVTRPLDVTAEWLRAKQVGPESFALGAFDEREELLGVISFTRVSRLKERHKAMIHGVYVVAEARGRGVGRALVAETLTRARQLPELTQVQLSAVTRQVASRVTIFPGPNLALRLVFGVDDGQTGPACGSDERSVRGNKRCLGQTVSTGASE